MRSKSAWWMLLVALMFGVVVAEPPVTPVAPPPPGPGAKVFLIPIHGEITDLTSRFVRRCIDEAVATGATTIVFDMNTPGGMVSSANEISSAIKRCSVPTLAWVDHEAISAGSLISLACNAIVTAPRGRIGDCAPIMIDPATGGLQSLGETERAKIDSYILAEFRDSAQKNGYPVVLCEAMVRTGEAIYRIKNPATGEVKYVFESQLPAYGLQLTKQQLAAVAARPADTAAAPGAPGAWVVQKRVLEEKKLLTLTASEAVEYGFAKAYIDNDRELMQYLRGEPANLHRFESNWSENLVVWLTSPVVRGVLGVILLISVYGAMHAPGFGVAEAVAIGTALILFGAPYLAGLASATDILLVVVGFVLIAAEVFVIPGFGIVGIVGIAMVLTGLVLSFVPPEPGGAWWPHLRGTWNAMETGLITVACSLAAASALLVVLSRYFGSLPVFNRLVLQAATPAELPGDFAAAQASSSPVRVGAIGNVTSGLRPSGWVEIDGQPIDVVTHGEWIERGTTVRIVAIEGNRVIVEKA